MLDFNTLYKINQVRAIELEVEIENGLDNDIDISEQELAEIEEWLNPQH